MSFFRDMFYAVATGAIIGIVIRQRRERREAMARQAQAVPPVIAPARRWRRRPRRWQNPPGLPPGSRR